MLCLMIGCYVAASGRDGRRHDCGVLTQQFPRPRGRPALDCALHLSFCSAWSIPNLNSINMATDLDRRKREIIEIGDSSGLRLAWHRLQEPALRELVLVEPKDYGNNPDDDTGDIVYSRIKDLARFLHELEPALHGEANKPRTLKCKGWYEDQATSQFCFVYHLPPECANHTEKLDFVTLYQAYSISKPPVEMRIRLAQALAETILSIHQRGWVHKGIRSDHVLFFPPTPGARPSIDCPRLVGFDYARRDGPNEYSEKPM